MLNRVISSKSFLSTVLVVLGISLVTVSGCTVAAKNSDEPDIETKSKEQSAAVNTVSPTAQKRSASKGTIQIVSGSPADTVRIFYKNLRERRFREAMMLTNLRHAVEGLTDEDMQDLNGDFEPLAQQVPDEIQINGEIITNNLATVTAKLPNTETGTIELTKIELRREKDNWIIVTADSEAETLAKKEGKNYFFVLRMDIHQTEAQVMMERIAKAQTLYAMQNGGIFADLPTLVGAGFLPEDVNTSKSTGYRFNISLASDSKKYLANAVPDVYGKTGKLSFLLEADAADQKAHLKSEDRKGKPLKK